MQIRLNLAVPRSFTTSCLGGAGVVYRGVHPINALVADSHDGFKSLFLPGWFMCIHVPGSLSFVCLLIRPRPGTYCHPTLLCRFGFVLSSRCSALGLPAGIQLVVWVGFVPSSPRSDCSDTHTLNPPMLTVRLVRAFLRFWHFLPRFCSRSLFVRVSFHTLLASCRVVDFLWPSRDMPETPNFAPSTLASGLILVWCAAARWDWFDSRSGGSACSHCNCVFLLPDWVLLSRAVFLCGGGYARWPFGCGSDCFLVVGFGCVSTCLAPGLEWFCPAPVGLFAS